jgi:HAD superfamily hydrolase (TIGR01490 family)
MGNIGAFFDIDGTIYREGLITEVFKKLIKYELVDPMRWHAEVKPKYIRWDKRIGDYDDYLLGMVDIYKETLTGLYKNQIEFIAKKVIDQKGDRVYTYTRDRIDWHKKNNHKLIAISGSPIEIVREMSKKYGIDVYRGSIYVLDENGIYTGDIIPMWDSKSKEKAMKDIAKDYDIDLSLSYPICINPTKELLKKVIEDEVNDRIKIIVERKDVVYTMNTDCVDFK